MTHALFCICCVTVLGASCSCSTPPEELRKHHRVIDAILRAKTRKYAGTYKVGFLCKE